MNKEKTTQNISKRYDSTFLEYLRTKAKFTKTSLNDQQRELLDNIWMRLKILGWEISGFTIYKDSQTGQFKRKQGDKNLSLEDVNKECNEIEDMFKLLPIKKQRSTKIKKMYKKYPQKNNPDIE